MTTSKLEGNANVIYLLSSLTRQGLLGFLKDTTLNDYDILLNYECEGGIFRRPWHPETGHPVHSFFRELHECCVEAKVNPEKITLYWNNLNSHSLYETWGERNKVPQKWRPFKKVGCTLGPLINAEINEASYNYYMENRDQERPKLFSCLNGAARTHRIDLLNYLHMEKLLDDAVWSYVDDKPFMPGFPNQRLLPELEKMVPKSVDNKDTVSEVSFINPRGNEFWSAFEDTYFDVVTGTFYHHDITVYPEFDWWHTVDVCEKIGRSIVNMRPFVVVGNKHSLKHLRLAGFKTFPHIFDESYDDLDDSKRLLAIVNQLKQLSRSEIHDVTNSDYTKDILQHNRERMLELRKLHEQGDEIVFEQ